MKKLGLVLFLGLFSYPLHAITATVSGMEVKLEYTEPSENVPDADGITTPLDDLASTAIYFQAETSTTPVLGIVVPASALTGGGQIQTQVVVPSQNRRRITYTLWAVATDIYGNVSPQSNTITVVVDKLAPAAPQ